MAATLGLGDVIELKLFCTLKDQLSVNVLHYRVSATAGAIAITDALAAAALDTKFAVRMKDLITSDAAYAGLTVQRIRPLAAPPVQNITGAGAGNGGAPSLPRQVAGLIKKGTTLAGRKERGRIYLPFPGEPQSDGNPPVPTAGYQAALQTFADHMDDLVSVASGADSITLQPVLYHRATHTTSDVVFTVTRARWATQRRRGDFGQANKNPFA